MIEIVFVILFITFILVNENILKYIHIKQVYDNYSLIKFCIKNILLALPFLTLYFNYETIINKTPKKKRYVSNTQKKYIAAAQVWRCNYCKNMLDASYEIDHIVPLYKNGTNDVNNLQALCRNCHGKKTVMDRIKSD